MLKIVKICKAEKRNILRAIHIINGGRNANKIIAIMPRADQIQDFSITPAQYDFAFKLVPKLTIQVSPSSSTMFTASMLERFEKLNSKIKPSKSNVEESANCRS